MIQSLQQVPPKLQKKLLTLGGTRVALVFAREPHVAALLTQGKLFTQSIRLQRGRRNQCHTNAAAIWGEDIDRYRLATGYALSRGCWRQHSWVVDEKHLYETTEKREKYFGIELDQVHACRFWVVNFLEVRYPGPWNLMLKIGKQAQCSEPL